MKFSCEKSVILNAVTAASRTVTTRSSIPALEGILIEGTDQNVTFTSYNLATGVSAVINTDNVQPGAIVINARLLGEIVRKSPDSYITLEANSDLTVKITCGMSEFTIAGISPQDFPELLPTENDRSLEIQSGLLKSMISMTIFAVSDNENKPVHTGSLFDVKEGILNLVSVDGYRMAIRSEQVLAASDSFSFVVPGSALREVERLCSEGEDPVKIYFGQRHITFEFGDVTLVSRLLEGDFINYSAAIPKEMKQNVIVETKQLLDAVDRVSLIINERLKTPVRCVFEENLIRLSCNTAMGKANDEIITEGGGEPLEIGFNNRYLRDALRAVPDDKVSIQLVSGLSPCIIRPIEGNNYVYMVLPVRLKV